MSTTFPSAARGFAIVAAIVILVILAGLAGFVVSLTTSQNLSMAQDVQSARAYQAARAGIEWGIAKWLEAAPSSSCLSNALPASGTFDGGITVTVVGTLSSGGGRNFCTLAATATTGGAAGSVGYAERQLRVVVEGNP